MTWAEHVQAIQNGLPGFPAVEIVWEDCASFGVEWTDKVETAVKITTTVGYLVAQSEDSVSVVLHVNPDHVGNGAVIPISAILSWRDLT